MKPTLPILALACLALLPAHLPAQNTFTVPVPPVSVSISVNGTSSAVPFVTGSASWSSGGSMSSSSGGSTSWSSGGSTSGPLSISVGAPPVSASADNMRAAWIAEAESRKDAEVITENESGPFSRLNRNVVALGNLAGPVSIIHGDFYSLGDVSGPVSVVGGNATILGTVNGPVSVVHGNLRVAGRINGTVSTVGGNIIRSSGSAITGSTSSNWAWSGFTTHHSHHGPHFPVIMCSIVLLQWFLLALWLAAAILLSVAMPGTLTRIAGVIRNDPLQTSAIGLLFWIVFWFLFLLSAALSLFVVGLPLIGLLVIVYIGANWFGMTAVFLFVGHEICTRMKWDTSSPLLPVLAGALALGIVPVAGFLFWLIAGLPAAGAIVLSITRDGQARTTPSSAP